MPSPRSAENALSLYLRRMVAEMAAAFRAELRAPGALDAAPSTPAEAAQRAANRAAARFQARYSTSGIKTKVQRIMGSTERAQSAAWRGRIEKLYGVSSKGLLAAEAVKATTAQFVAETVVWAEKLQHDAMRYFVSGATEALEQGLSLDEVVARFDGMVETRRNHARFVARNQIQTYNAVVGKVRAENLGVTRAVWHAAMDERTRPSHEDRNGREFDLAVGLESDLDDLSLIPGVDFNCRCWAEYVLPEESTEK